MIRRRLDTIRSETGAAAVSIVFLMAAIIVGGIVTTAAISLAQTAGATKTFAAMNAALDERLSAYTGDLQTEDSPSAESICYPGLAACVSITSVEDTAARRTITLVATADGSGKTSTRVELITATSGSHISGFDEQGNPVWVTVDGSTTFDGYR